jgi:hypothetical protein
MALLAGASDPFCAGWQAQPTNRRANGIKVVFFMCILIIDQKPKVKKKGRSNSPLYMNF